MKEITFDMLALALPKGKRNLLTEELVEEINSNLTNPLLEEHLRDNILGFMNVLQEGKYKLQEYFNAVRYCTYRLSGNAQNQSYVKTFPDRYQRYVSKDTPQKDISGIISVYNKSKLVTAIMAQSMIPIHISNQDLHQQAILKLADLMMNAKSEKVQSDSAGKLVDVLKAPDVAKIELDIGVSTDGAISDLMAAVGSLAKIQQERIIDGTVTVKEVACSPIESKRLV